MKRILVINPNTTASVTDMVVASCRRAHPQVAWEGVTARFGAAYIASETAYAIASHAALDAYAATYAGHDAVLIACFGDPGLLALRELTDVPVVSLAQESFMAAARQGPFAVVTGGKAWEPMLARFARTHQLDTHLVGIFTVELTGGQIAAAPERALDSLLEACRLGVAAGARGIVLGGAALVGLADRLQQRLDIPVLDNVVLGAQAAVRAAMQPHAPASRPVATMGAVSGLSEALSAQLMRH